MDLNPLNPPKKSIFIKQILEMKKGLRSDAQPLFIAVTAIFSYFTVLQAFKDQSV